MVNQTALRFGYSDTLIYEYSNWLVMLRDPQITLGSLVLCAKSEATAFADLPPQAFAELSTAIADIERVLTSVIRFEKINYLMLMMSDPNVHFHVLPRYSGSREACGIEIEDRAWPVAPNVADGHALAAEARDALRDLIKSRWR